MQNLKLFSVLCAFIAVAVIGCKKGDTGPAGPKGASGSDSVLHSAWIALNTTIINVNNSTTPADTTYGQSITASGLSSSILNTGVVLSYIGLLPSSTGLTDTLVINASDIYTYTGYYLTQDLSPQLIELYAGADFSGNLYRYVLIPSSALTTGIGGKVYTKAQLKAMTYAEAQKTFGISTTSSVTN